jgi:hypothetical protein
MTCRLQLYQLAQRLNKLQIDLKPLKKTKWRVWRCLSVTHEDGSSGAGTPARFFQRARHPNASDPVQELP